MAIVLLCQTYFVIFLDMQRLSIFGLPYKSSQLSFSDEETDHIICQYCSNFPLYYNVIYIISEISRVVGPSSAAEHAISPDFSGKYGMECLNTRFSLPTVLCANTIFPRTLLCAGYSVKLLKIIIYTYSFPSIKDVSQLASYSEIHNQLPSFKFINHSSYRLRYDIRQAELSLVAIQSLYYCGHMIYFCGAQLGTIHFRILAVSYFF